MNLHLNTALLEGYKSTSQQIRVLTEGWMKSNGYCPCCGNKPIKKFENNKPVADFFCPQCHEEYELKSKNGMGVGKSVADGAYRTMIERIQSDTNPNFFFLAYKKTDYSVQQLMLVPKHFVTADMIVPRTKGIPNRPDYIMCSMNIASLPDSGKILLIDKAKTVAPENVLKQWQANLFLRGQKADKKGWLLAVMKCIDKLPEKFTLNQMYEFETQLSIQFPANNHIKDKIRQQLQILRDQNMIEFIGRGLYRKIGER